jgi:hypothetical protein
MLSAEARVAQLTQELEEMRMRMAQQASMCQPCSHIGGVLTFIAGDGSQSCSQHDTSTSNVVVGLGGGFFLSWSCSS